MGSPGGQQYTNDVFWMRVAIEIAQRAPTKGQRPFGCVIVNRQNEHLAEAFGSETPVDPTCHSEIRAIRAACQHRGGLLYGCTIYSTHQPCAMCAGAICHAKLSRVVYGSRRIDLHHLFRLKDDALQAIYASTTHSPELVGGVLRDECIALFDQEMACLASSSA